MSITFQDVADELAELVAGRLKELRLANGWTLEELATRAGLHRTTLGLVERGRRHLSLDSAKRLADALGEPLWSIVRQAEAPSEAVPDPDHSG